jgi:vanillate O-demethylase ferredoxin subunit
MMQRSPTRSSGANASPRHDWLDVVVEAVQRRGNTLRLTLQGGPGVSLPACGPGSHVALDCAGAGTRYYSLTGPRSPDGAYVLGVKLAPESTGGSRWVFDNARAGMPLKISAPRNHFPLSEGEPAYLFVSGGIGLTPIIAMLYELRERGVRARWVHMSRTPGDMPFDDWIDELSLYHDVVLHFDTASDGLYDLDAELERVPADTAVYCCGPAAVMARVQEFGKRSGRADKYHFEFFSGPTEPEGDSGEFVVVQQSTGRRIAVPKTQTMLAALRAAGIEMQSECEYGVCGWCAVGVVCGRPQHFDSYLTEAEREANRIVLPCVSRSETSELILDI